MDFSSTVNEVIDATKRPDKQTEIQSSVNKAILFFSLKGEFPQDIVETSLAIDPTLYGDTVSLASLTRFRKFSYVKRYGQLGYIKPIGADQVLTPAGSMQKDVYFLAGTNLTYTLKELSASLEIGYFQYPPILTTTDTHWLLDVIPWAIIDKAAANIFKHIGDDSSWKSHEATANELYLAYRRSLEN